MKHLYFLFITLLSISFASAQSNETGIQTGAPSFRNLKQTDVLAKPGNTVPLEKVQKQLLKVNTSVSPKLQQRALLAEPQVLSTETFSNGAQIHTIQTSNGTVRRQVQLAGQEKKLSIARSKVQPKAPQVVADDNTLYEGFEGWDKTTEYWIPLGWTKEDRSSSGDDYSWMVVSGIRISESEIVYPYEGTATAYLSPAYVGSGTNYFFLPSEEWLETPVFTPKQYDKLFFKLNYNPGWMLFNYPQYQSSQGKNVAFNKINQEVEVYISTNEGQDWAKVWTALDDAQAYGRQDLIDAINYGGWWSSFSVDLTNYVGRNIMVGFRCNNINDGVNFILLDEIRVGVPQPEAFYRRPQGYLFYTFSEEYEAAPVIFGPAYTPARWLNYSNRESESFAWIFTDPVSTTGNNQIEFQDINPEITYPYFQADIPILEASATGAIPSAYQWEGYYLQTGGSTNVRFQGNTEPTVCGAGNYDVNLGMDVGYFSSSYPNGTIFGSGNEPFWGANFKLNGIGNYYEKPLSKYIFDRLWIHCYKFTAQPNAEMQVIIHRIVNNYLADTIATSICYGRDVEAINRGKDANGKDVFYYTIPFDFDEYLEIEDAILVEFKGYLNPATVSTIAPIVQSEDSPSGDCYAYVFLTATTSDGGKEELLYPMTSIVGWSTSFYFNMNAEFTFMHTEDNRYEVPAQGGTKDFSIDSYYYPASWWLDTTPPDWITLEEPILVDQETGIATLPVTVAALPNGVEGRNYNVYLYSPGSSLTIQIKQGNAGWLPDIVGIPNTQPEATQVIRQGNNFQLTYPKAAQSLAVYNIAGQKVAEKALNASGTDVLPAAHLANGVYILKFNGTNTTVKVIK
ncbi:hypothetical protein FACS189413_02090 [Bacteroidia bacterium]|nr:hypothetical protein FACS189413_02090 [Bacteroidia bacterium]